MRYLNPTSESRLTHRTRASPPPDLHWREAPAVQDNQKPVNEHHDKPPSRTPFLPASRTHRVDQKSPSGCFKGSAVRRLLRPNCLAETTGRLRPGAPEMAVQSQNRCLLHSRRHARTTNSDNLSVLARVSSPRVDSSPIWTRVSSGLSHLVEMVPG